MEKIEQLELISYFSSEIFCLIGILINIIMFLFFSRKYNIKRLSDLTTFGVFTINSLVCLGIFLKNKIIFGDFNFSLLNENFIFNNEIFLYKFLIYTFFACFVLCTYKITRRANFMGTIMNSSLLFLSLTSSILTNTQNGILAFLFLDLASFFAYKFASNMRIRKYETYSIDFVLMSSTSSILFYSLYLASFLVKEDLQLAIVQVCMACALLLKAGIFPIYNYTLNRHTKKNLAYSMLLFGFLPYLGIFAFVKFTQNINTTNEIFFITISLFLILVIITSAINIHKTKNLIKYLANIIYLNSSFYLIAIFTLQEYKLCENIMFASMFAVFALYSLYAILKINLKSEKLNISILFGLFIKNRLFCTLFSIAVLTLICVIPNLLLKNNIELLKGIYIFDKIGSYFIIIYLFANILVVLKSLKIIKTCYTKKDIFKSAPQLIKRTTTNYVVPIIIISLLFLLMFL